MAAHQFSLLPATVLTFTLTHPYQIRATNKGSPRSSVLCTGRTLDNQDMACLCLSTPLIEHLCAHVDSTAVVFNISVDDNSVDHLACLLTCIHQMQVCTAFVRVQFIESF